MRLQVLSFLMKAIISLWVSPPPSPLGQSSPAHIIQVMSTPSCSAFFMIFVVVRQVQMYLGLLSNLDDFSQQQPWQPERLCSYLRCLWLYMVMVAPTAAHDPKNPTKTAALKVAQRIFSSRVDLWRWAHHKRIQGGKTSIFVCVWVAKLLRLH